MERLKIGWPERKDTHQSIFNLDSVIRLIGGGCNGNEKCKKMFVQGPPQCKVVGVLSRLVT